MLCSGLLDRDEGVGPGQPGVWALGGRGALRDGGLLTRRQKSQVGDTYLGHLVTVPLES